MRLVEKAEIDIIIKEKLRDGARGPRIDLGLQHVEIDIKGRAFGMLFRIGRHRDFEIPVQARCFHQFRRARKAFRMRFVF